MRIFQIQCLMSVYIHYSKVSERMSIPVRYSMLTDVELQTAGDSKLNMSGFDLSDVDDIDELDY